MQTRQIIEDFLAGDFARKNIFSHLQAGIPFPFLYKDGIGLRFWFHRLCCTADGITLSSPVFEVRFTYPSGRIIYFSETDAAFQPHEIKIPKNNMRLFKSVYTRCYSACDEVLDFFDAHHTLTPTALKEYYRCVDKNTPDIGIDKWYGGSYDYNRGI